MFKGQEIKDYKRRKAGGNPELQTIEDLYYILRECWSKETASPDFQPSWSDTDKSLGQSEVTALLVNRLFGGTIHICTDGDGRPRYFNCIEGHSVDLTGDFYDLFFPSFSYDNNQTVERSYLENLEDVKKRYRILVNHISLFLQNRIIEDNNKKQACIRSVYSIPDYSNSIGPTYSGYHSVKKAGSPASKANKKSTKRSDSADSTIVRTGCSVTVKYLPTNEIMSLKLVSTRSETRYKSMGYKTKKYSEEILTSDADGFETVSDNSPLGKAIINKKAGDLVEFRVNGREQQYMILSIHE